MKTLKQIVGFATLCLVALFAFGVLYSIGTAPAKAEGSRPRVDYAVIATNPVTVPMQTALATDVLNFFACTKDMPRTASAKLEQANKDAITAAADRDLTKWNKEAATVRSEIARLKPIYCT